MDYEFCVHILKKLPVEEDIPLCIYKGSEINIGYTFPHSPDEQGLYYFQPGEFNSAKISELLSSRYQKNYKSFVGFINPLTSEFMLDVFSHATECSHLSKLNVILFLPADQTKKSLEPFVNMIAHLRAPDGCPWDRKQTLQSLRTNLIEEAYEALEAMDNQDRDALREELGDLLLQIVLQSQICTEMNAFDIFDVINGIYKKIHFRHPHVFGDVIVDNAENVMENWEKWKAQERDKKPVDQSILASIPKSLPALSVAQKYQERAARVGFDWPEKAPVLEKISEEILEVQQAQGEKEKALELGDLLFALVNLIRWEGFDAENLLREANNKFLKRFNFIETEAAKQGRQISSLTLQEMDEIWNRSKKLDL
jgi:tetrapyrrole methylase family protein/MazG family protein